MITLLFHFHFQVIKMKGGRFEDHIRNKINYKEEDAGLFKQWMRKEKGQLAEIQFFSYIQRACGFLKENS